MSKQNQNTVNTDDPNPLVAFTNEYFCVAQTGQHYNLNIPFALQDLLMHLGKEDLTKLHRELNEVCDLFTEHVVDKIDSKSFKSKYKALKGLEAFVRELFVKINIEVVHD